MKKYKQRSGHFKLKMMRLKLKIKNGCRLLKYTIFKVPGLRDQTKNLNGYLFNLGFYYLVKQT